MRRNWKSGLALGSALLAVPVWASADDKASEKANDKAGDKQSCIAAAEQGQSQRDDGQYRAARDSFLKCASDACPRVIVQSCTKWLRELDESAPTIVLGAKDDQGNDLTAVKVTFDGAPFATELTGKPMAADAGEHVVRFEREGSIPVEQKLLLRAGERARVVSVTLKPVAIAEVDAAIEPSETPAIAPAPPEAALSAHHVIGATLGLGAVAAAVTGVVFILQSNQKKNDAEGLRSGLPSDGCVGAASAAVSAKCMSLNDAVDAQHNDLTVATALFAGAGGLAVGAIATWLLWPKDSSSPPTTGSVVPTKGGAVLQLRGTFR